MAEDSALRRIPSVERILSSTAFAPLVDELGRERVKDAVVAHLDALRNARAAYDEAAALADVRATPSPASRISSSTSTKAAAARATSIFPRSAGRSSAARRRS